MLSQRIGIKSALAALLLAAILNFAAPLGALADEYVPGPTLEEQVAKLESEIAGLTALVKSLTMQMQSIRESAKGDLGEFQPRLLAIEKLSKENAFDVRQLSATIGQLATKVNELSKLPGEVYTLRDTLKELRYYFDDQMDAMNAKVTNSDALIKNLTETSLKTAVVVQSLQSNFGPINDRLNATEQHIQLLQGQTDGLRSALDGLTNSSADGMDSLKAKLLTLDGQLTQLQSAMSQINQISQVIAEVEVSVTNISTRSQASEADQADMMEFLRKLEGYESQAGTLHDQIERLSAEFLIAARRAQEDANTIQENTSRIEMLQAMIAKQPEQQAGADMADIERLNQQLMGAFEQFEGTQRSLAQLQQSLASAKEQIKSEIMSTLPRVPSTEEITMMIQQSASQQLREAQERADGAQSMALIALLVGIGSIAVALLL